MRYPREHKTEVRQKIVKDASRRIGAEGLTGAAVSAVMRDAGLTHGGFYKHFESKDELLVESLKEAFRGIVDRLVRAAETSKRGTEWKAIVKTYLSSELSHQAEGWCPLATLGPELARADPEMKGRIFQELRNYRDSMLPFMPGGSTADKERAFFVIFSTMIGTVEIARLLPENAMREKVLTNARDFLLRSF